MPKKPAAKIDPAAVPLTDREQLLLERYLIHLNKLQAWREAGYSDKSTGTITRTFTKPNFARALNAALAERAKKNRAEADEVHAFLTNVMRNSHLGDVLKPDGERGLQFDFSEATPDKLKLMGKVKIKTIYGTGEDSDLEIGTEVNVEPLSPMEAADKLARVLGMYKDKLEVVDGTALAKKLNEARARAATRADAARAAAAKKKGDAV